MITLYYAPDNASLIVRILLEELHLPYQTKLVDRSKQEQSGEEYLKLNPSGLIPVCLINNEPVFETAAILLGLADIHNKFVLPVNHEQRPQMLKWLFFLSNSLHPDLRLRFYPEKYVGSNQAALDACETITLARIKDRIGQLDTQYRVNNQDYLFGTEPSIVDFYLAACIRWLQLYPKDKTGQFSCADFPYILAMARKMEVREAVIRACSHEGIKENIFSKPEYADPPEGVSL